VFEGVIRVQTRTGDSHRGREGEEEREWRCLRGRNCGGRYVPSVTVVSRKLHPLSCEDEEVILRCPALCP
jgi:hypothetical protein